MTGGRRDGADGGKVLGKLSLLLKSQRGRINPLYLIMLLCVDGMPATAQPRCGNGERWPEDRAHSLRVAEGKTGRTYIFFMTFRTIK